MRNLLAFFVVVLFSVQTMAAEKYIAGKHYEVLPEPVVTRDKDKIEVIELFWYGCGHCFNFEPIVQNWKKDLADDVDFHQVPAIWNPRMKKHAQVFYVAKTLGVLDKTHQPFFNKLNLEKKSMADNDDIAAFFKQFGVDRATFDKTIKSFGITSQVNLAESRAKSYRMQGTPEMIVNGKYRVSSPMAGNQSKMLEVVDFLIEKERKAGS